MIDARLSSLLSICQYSTAYRGTQPNSVQEVERKGRYEDGSRQWTVDLVGEELITLAGVCTLACWRPPVSGYGACADFQSDA